MKRHDRSRSLVATWLDTNSHDVSQPVLSALTGAHWGSLGLARAEAKGDPNQVPRSPSTSHPFVPRHSKHFMDSTPQSLMTR